jgi:hypothetical protein
MSRTIVCFGMLAAIVVFADAVPGRAQQTTRQFCPAGYSLIGDVCISDKTGDVVLPNKKQ